MATQQPADHDANPFHTDRDCDEDCRGCASCYVRTGDTLCGRSCRHWRENSPDDVERLEEEDALAGMERDQQDGIGVKA